MNENNIYNNNDTPEQNNANREQSYQPNPNWRETPYQSTPSYGSYTYPSNNYNPYSGSQVNYTPAPQKKKEKGRVSYGVIALICCIAVVFSGLAGFGGAYVGGLLSKGSSSSSGTSYDSSTMVVYKDVTELGDFGTEQMNYKQVAALVQDSVVEITTEFNSQSIWYQYVTEGAGSGVIISADGYVVTNAHVITNDSTGGIADAITVRLHNGSEYKASVKGYDSDDDIAVLKIEGEGFTPAVIGESDKLQIGEEVIAVGNPLGELGGSVTNGIVSSTNREILVNGVTMNLIQHNAAVNPGNSGGGLFNIQGQLIGIVNAKSSGTDIEGLGFAIPISDAMETVEQLMEYGYVRGKVVLGFNYSEVGADSSYSFYYGLQPGVYVSGVMEGYNDDILTVGDRIVAIEGVTVSTAADIKAILTSHSVGDKIEVQIERRGRLINATLTCFEKVPDGQQSVDFGENN